MMTRAWNRLLCLTFVSVGLAACVSTWTPPRAAGWETQSVQLPGRMDTTNTNISADGKYVSVAGNNIHESPVRVVDERGRVVASFAKPYVEFSSGANAGSVFFLSGDRILYFEPTGYRVIRAKEKKMLCWRIQSLKGAAPEQRVCAELPVEMNRPYWAIVTDGTFDMWYQGAARPDPSKKVDRLGTKRVRADVATGDVLEFESIEEQFVVDWLKGEGYAKYFRRQDRDAFLAACDRSKLDAIEQSEHPHISAWHAPSCTFVSLGKNWRGERATVWIHRQK